MWNNILDNNKKITKKVAKECAKNILIDGLADNEEYNKKFSEKELNLIYEQIDILGERMAKSVGKHYYSM